MKEYDAYLFDWDGTLASTLEIWLEIMRQQYEEYGLHLSDEQIVESFGKLEPVSLKFGIPESKIKQFTAGVQAIANTRVPEAPLFVGVHDVLIGLKQADKKLALISTGWRETITTVLTMHQLRDVFDVVISGDDVRNHKPDPEGILATLEKLDINKGQAVMVGDSDKDLQAASNAGVEGILFYPEKHKLFRDYDYLKGFHPVHVFSNWLDFKDQLRLNS